MLRLLIRELKLFQHLGPVHQSNLIYAEWGFGKHSSHCIIWQRASGGIKRLLIEFLVPVCPLVGEVKIKLLP